MPELPEVETTRRGIAPRVKGQRISQLRVREYRLRWPLDPDLPWRLAGLRVLDIRRRAKYLLFELESGGFLIHLGMSGSLRWVDAKESPRKHDHFDLLFASGGLLRFNDPRRFGALLWASEGAQNHELLANLGPEPLDDAMDGDYLWQRSRGRRQAIKSFLMDARMLVGVGNIYASEALFVAGIHPGRSVSRISRQRYHALAQAIKSVLGDAIGQGGTTLRDFIGGDGKPGYFRQQLQVYGRQGEPCRFCSTPIKRRLINQRASYYCAQCQN